MYVNLFPFNPLGNTAALTVTAVSANVQVPQLNGGNSPNLIAVRVVVVGTAAVFVNFGATNAVTAAIPASGANGSGVILNPGTEKTFLVPNGSWIAAIAGGAGSTIYVTPGESE